MITLSERLHKYGSIVIRLIHQTYTFVSHMHYQHNAIHSLLHVSYQLLWFASGFQENFRFVTLSFHALENFCKFFFVRLFLITFSLFKLIQNIFMICVIVMSPHNQHFTKIVSHFDF